MSVDQVEAIEQLQRRCTAGQVRLNQYGALDLEYVTGLVLPALATAMASVYPDVEERHIVPSQVSGTTMLVTHYTGLATAVSMLRSLAYGQGPSLRLYDSLHCNDPGEGNYLVDALSSDAEHRWLAHGSTASHAYITSFVYDESDESKEDMSDDLVFWRTYGKEGTGCSLTANVPEELLRRVLYGPDAVGNTKTVLLPILNAVTPLARARENFAKAIAETIWKGLEGVTYLYKDEAYHHEKEHRAVIPAESTNGEKDLIHFEPSEASGLPLRVRHYRETGGLALRKILTSRSKLVLGPCVNDRYSVRLYLEDLRRQAQRVGPDLLNFRIEESKISYRNS